MLKMERSGELKCAATGSPGELPLIERGYSVNRVCQSPLCFPNIKFFTASTSNGVDHN